MSSVNPHGAQGAGADPPDLHRYRVVLTNLTVGLGSEVTWAKVMGKLTAAGFVDVRSGTGSHLLLKQPTTGKEVWAAVHTRKDAGRLGKRILREPGVE